MPFPGYRPQTQLFLFWAILKLFCVSFQIGRSCGRQQRLVGGAPTSGKERKLAKTLRQEHHERTIPIASVWRFTKSAVYDVLTKD